MRERPPLRRIIPLERGDRVRILKRTCWEESGAPGSGPMNGIQPRPSLTLVSARLERGSFILTSNKGFGE